MSPSWVSDEENSHPGAAGGGRLGAGPKEQVHRYIDMQRESERAVVRGANLRPLAAGGSVHELRSVCACGSLRRLTSSFSPDPPEVKWLCCLKMLTRLQPVSSRILAV